jgi:hypothetical protein
MKVHLANVTFWGKDSTMPSLPARNIRGELSVDGSILVFESTWQDFSLAIPLEQVKASYVDSQTADDFHSLLKQYLSFGLIVTVAWYTVVTWYDAGHDMDMTAMFLIGTGNPIICEKRATRLAKAILALRSEKLLAIRTGATIVYRMGK